MNLNPWKATRFEGRWPTPIISAILALALSILLFPFGVLAVAALGSIPLPKTPLLPPELGGSLEESQNFTKQVGNLALICCLGFVAFSVVCSFLDEGQFKKFADFARQLASYSVFPNQLYGNIDPKTAIIANSDYAVLRSMFISLFCPVLLSVRMQDMERGVRIGAGIYILIKKERRPYAWGFFAALFSLSTPSILFIFADRNAADAGLIPRIYLLSGPIVYSAITGLVEIVGWLCLWVAVIMALYPKEKIE